MEHAIIEATIRTRAGKGDSGRLRVQGRIPAVYYGPGQENLHLSITMDSLEKAVAGPSGLNSLIELKIEGGKSHKVLLKDYQADPIKRFFKHADFIHVDANKKINISVPVVLTGKPIGVKEGGVLEQVTRNIEILCFPTKIPLQIEVDITDLKIGHNLHLHDVKLPEGVEPVKGTDLTIAAIFQPRDEVEATPAAAGAAEPEVLTAKKEEGADAAKPGDKAKAGEKKEEKKK